ncbi:polysaccharide biosynthesis C-terminal domain-containing protein [Marivirga sp. S37H4]|uniref:Polysaccharide biosynthesis C-terminal domain-containing protein n=1 Tax=Marivirga aurantiaca TaxID=2802615 RepID=A0A934X2I9_9BACT|nr:polysaccharide biosynthesis C-terminal domain-containing protein [Marivirga aurantiaca]MBK6267291.1 polysaccharide biosynthesis C-terminal domain-containing protein [Marivirga aurantiaca]
MGIVIKQSAYASAISYFGVVIGAINMIFLFPQFFTPKELGLFKAIFSMAILLAPFAQAGLGRSTLRYFPRFNKSNKTAGRFLSLIFILGFFTIMLFLLIFQLVDDWVFSFFEKNAPELVHHYWLILILAFLMVYITIFEAYYKALMNIVVPTFMKEFFLRIVVSLLGLLYFTEIITFQWFLYFTILSYAFSLILLILYLAAKNQLHFNFSIFQIDKTFFKELLKYMVYIMAGAVGSVIVLQIDQLMVTGYLGLEENAIYVIAFFMATVIEIPRRAIAQMSDSIIAKSFEFERLDEVKKIYKQSSINQLILGSFVFLLIILNLDNIYNIMPKGEIYNAGKWIVVLIGFGKIIDMGFGVNSEIIVSSSLYKANILFVVVLAILTVGLNILLIPTYGLLGAAIATLSAIFSFNLIKMLFIWYHFKFQPFSIHTLTTLLLSAISFVIVYFIPKIENPILNIMWISIILTLVFSSLMLLFKPSKEINNLLKLLKNKFIP